jgi:hypothetical protein
LRARAQRLYWFCALWAISVTATLIVAEMLRWFFGRILS